MSDIIKRGSKAFDLTCAGTFCPVLLCTQVVVLIASELLLEAVGLRTYDWSVCQSPTMSDIIKRGRVDVKKRNIFGGYKNRWVLLRNSLTLNCKTVEILEGDDEAEESRDVIRLNEAWSVKPSRNRGRYTFELVKCEEVVLTFSCSSTLERDDWMESFRVLNQLALPCNLEQHSSSQQPGQDYFTVTLVKNRNAVEINHSGSYLLSITDSAIFLHWRTGAIAHHWPKRSVVKLHLHPKKDGHFVLHAKRSNKDDVMEFEFTTTKESAMQILKTWNIRLLESIAYNPQQLNEIASIINPSSAGDGKKVKNKSMSSKSFRSTKNTAITNHREEPIRRAGSFSKLQTYRTDINGMAAGMGTATGMGTAAGMGTASAGNSPAVMRNRQGELVRVGGLPPLPREANVRSWASDEQYGPGAMGSLSQDSYGLNSTRVSPPPLPPRPSDRLRDGSMNFRTQDEDPDYAYIKEDEIKSQPNLPRPLDPSTSVDDALFELERDIMRDNQARKIEEEEKRRRAARRQVSQPVQSSAKLTLGPPVFPIADPQDYMDFVPQDYTDFKPSKPQSVSVSSDPEKTSLPPPAHIRSASEPDPQPYQPSSKNLSQPPVFEDEEDPLGSVGLSRDSGPLTQKPMSRSSQHIPGRSQSAQAFMGPVPSLPPRTWRNSSSGNFELNTAGGAGSPAGSSPSSSLVTVAENRPKTSQDMYSVVQRPSNKAVPFSGSDYSMSQSLSTLKGVSAPPIPAPPTSTPVISDIQSNTSSTPSTSSTVTSTAPSPTASAGLSTSDTTQEGTSDSPQSKPTTPPPIPPRSPTKDRLSRKSSSSSSSSSSSNRCPHCRGSRRQHKAQVSKTVSLGTALGSNQSPEDCRKSLPDLAGSEKMVPENELKGRHHRGQRSRHCSRCSPESSMDTLHDGLESSKSATSLTNATLEYLQLVGEEQGKDTDKTGKSDMDLMSSCLKYLDFLNQEIDVSSSLAAAPGAGAVLPPELVSSHNPESAQSNRATMSSAGSGTGPSAHFVPVTQTSPMSEMPKKRNSGTEVKSLEMNLNRAKMETQRTLATLSQPLHPPSTGTYGVGLLPVSTHSGIHPPTTHSGIHPPTTHSGLHPPTTHSGLHPPTTHLTGTHLSSAHTVTRTSPIPNGHYQTSSTSHAAVTRATRTPHANGMVTHRSSSTTALVTPSTSSSFHNSAPPIVPPRSIVSLMQQPPTTSATPTNKLQQHQSLRSSSASQIHASSSSGSPSGRKGNHSVRIAHQQSSPNSRLNQRHHQSLTRPSSAVRPRDPMDPSGQSSTVFIHHLKGGLAHLV